MPVESGAMQVTTSPSQQEREGEGEESHSLDWRMLNSHPVFIHTREARGTTSHYDFRWLGLHCFVLKSTQLCTSRCTGKWLLLWWCTLFCPSLPTSCSLLLLLFLQTTGSVESAILSSHMFHCINCLHLETMRWQTWHLFYRADIPSMYWERWPNTKYE